MIKRKIFYIHIGYPKTATTTIQENLFYSLHKKNKINFLGRITRKNPLLGKRLLDYWTGDIQYLSENLDEQKRLNEKLINVFSYEMLTSTYYFNLDKKKYFIPIEIDKIVQRIKNFIDFYDLDVKILVSIRNHAELIYSLYVQQYFNIFRFIKELNTIEKYIENLLNRNRKFEKIFEMLYFFHIIEKYERVFGKDAIEILLYEDLLYNEDEYYSYWERLLGISKTEIIKAFAKKENSKRKGKKGYIIEEGLGEFLYQKVQSIAKDNSLFILNNSPTAKLVFHNLINFLNNKKVKRLEIAKFSPEVKEEIKDFFREDTIQLIKKFNLNFEIMKKYNYI